ncbi:hypothetical protein [Buttiauxella sp. 3AFRM03]|uniref:hypothetical protein n=1 Tax=Buttiauxella sp. 3AFRM03 TaxID=2479367 RepID=UPI0013901908|nr:hypothetical protein [Buttiauxella sp. 3AFRM03]
MGYVNIVCTCECLRVVTAYSKGGRAWETAEVKAIEKWNGEVNKLNNGTGK